MKTKQCTKCGETKPLSEFHKNRSRKDGLANRCKECMKAHTHKWYKANRDRKAATARKYRREHKEEEAARSRRWQQANPERAAAIKRKWARANPEKEAARGCRYRKANPEKEAAKKRKWRRDNPDKAGANDRRGRLKHRARKAGAAGSFTEAEFRTLVKAAGGCCPCCGRKFGLFLRPTRDHIVPLSQGGSDDISNIQPLCSRCNDRKGTKTIRYIP